MKGLEGLLLLDTVVEPGVGLRQRDDDRRKEDRRQHGRPTAERRRRDRRHASIRGLLLAAATLAATTPLHVKTRLEPLVLVSTFESNFRAIPAERAYDTFIQEAAETYKLDAALIRAVMRAESAFNPIVVSSAGALGLMQLMPGLAAEMGVEDPLDPRENIMGGARYLKQLLTLHKGNVPLTLASYNAGPGAVKRYRNRIPPFKETRNYVRKITGFLSERKK
jgi:soluble lytic murein transglycosylase-like protein